VSDEPVESVWTGYDGRVLAAISIGWLAIRLGREAIPPLLPVIIEDMAISPAVAGLGLTAMWFVYATCQYPGGRLSDALSRKTVLTTSLAVLVVGFLVLTVVTTYGGLLVGFILVGLGAGLYFAPARALLADSFGDRRGEVFGIQSAAGSIGAVTAAGVTLAALSFGIWQLSFLPVVCVLGVICLSLVLWHRQAYVLRWVRLGLGGTGHRIASHARVRTLLVAYVFVSFSWQGFLGFLPTFLQAEKGFRPVFASGAFAAVFIVAVIAGPLAGRFADMAPRVLVALSGIGLAIMGILSLVASSTPVIAIFGVLLAALGLRSFPPVMQSHLIGLFPGESMAGDFGAMKTVWTGIGSLSPTYVGLVATRATYNLAFASFVVYLTCSLCVLSYVFLSHTD